MTTPEKDFGLTRVRWEATEGKTVWGVSNGWNELVVIFTDRTFAVQGIEPGYEGDYDLTEEPSMFELTEYYEVLIRLGLTTEEELEARLKAQHEASLAALAERERAEFERLARKYAPKEAP